MAERDVKIRVTATDGASTQINRAGSALKNLAKDVKAARQDFNELAERGLALAGIVSGAVAGSFALAVRNSKELQAETGKVEYAYEKMFKTLGDTLARSDAFRKVINDTAGAFRTMEQAIRDNAGTIEGVFVSGVKSAAVAMRALSLVTKGWLDILVTAKELAGPTLSVAQSAAEQGLATADLSGRLLAGSPVLQSALGAVPVVGPGLALGAGIAGGLGAAGTEELRDASDRLSKTTNQTTIEVESWRAALKRAENQALNLEASFDKLDDALAGIGSGKSGKAPRKPGEGKDKTGVEMTFSEAEVLPWEEGEMPGLLMTDDWRRARGEEVARGGRQKDAFAKWQEAQAEDTAKYGKSIEDASRLTVEWGDALASTTSAMLQASLAAVAAGDGFAAAGIAAAGAFGGVAGSLGSSLMSGAIGTLGSSLSPGMGLALGLGLTAVGGIISGLTAPDDAKKRRHTKVDPMPVRIVQDDTARQTQTINLYVGGSVIQERNLGRTVNDALRRGERAGTIGGEG